MDQAMGRAELLIGKNRHGPTKTLDMAFEAQFTRFHDLVKDTHLPDGYPDGYIDE